MNRRVAIIDPLSSHGGMHYYDHDLASSLAKLGVGVELFSPPTGLSDPKQYQQHVYFEGVYGGAHIAKFKRAYKLTRDLLRSIFAARERKCSAIVFHVFKTDIFELLTAVFAKILNIPVLLIIHDVSRLDATARFEFRNLLVKSATRIIVHNEFSRASLLQVAPLASNKTVVIPHGNYISQFPSVLSRFEARRQLSISDEVFVLLFFGNPRREKGLSILLDALVPLKDQKNLLLVVAGKMKADDETLFKNKINQLGLSDRVRMEIGHVSDEMMPVYFSASSMVVLPYHRVYESGVALMSMTFGRSILASNLPVFNELVGASGGGRSFESGNVSSLTGEISRLIAGEFDHDALGQNAYRFVSEQRSWAVSATKWLDVLDSLADSRLESKNI